MNELYMINYINYINYISGHQPFFFIFLNKRENGVFVFKYTNLTFQNIKR